MTYQVMESCPICGTVLPHRHDYNEVGQAEESEFICKNCELSKVFSYGATEYTLGSLTWCWMWSDSWEMVRAQLEDFQWLCRILREALRP